MCAQDLTACLGVGCGRIPVRLLIHELTCRGPATDPGLAFYRCLGDDAMRSSEVKA